MSEENTEKKLSFNQEPVEETPKKKLPLIAKIFIGIIGSIVGLFVFVWVGLNVAKFPIYADFYSRKKDICDIPGLNSGTTPQGCTYDEVNDAIYTSSYSEKGAVVYTVKDGKTQAHNLYKDGKAFTGHVGGIATSGSYVYIADDSRVYTIESSALYGEEKNVEIGAGLAVNNQASFVFSDDTYLYVGEFHDGTHYITENYCELTGYYAIVARYALGSFTPNATAEPTLIQCISIRNKVQGFCVTNEGKFVLSTSYGLASSHIYVYAGDQLRKTGKQMYGVDLYYFDELEKNMLAPAMTEDLDIYKDGTVITLTESACNKYIFGKFFFANHVFSMDL